MDFHENFTTLDWCVVAGYLLLTTWVGHLLKGRQSSIKDFFLGGRSLPWLAVSGSIIATEISGVTFIGVPGMVYAAGGDFTYLQWGIGSIIARILVGIFFVKVFYEREIYSPYDYMGNRLGLASKRLATIIFQIGGILGQSVRVLVAALALKVVTPLEFDHCIWIIGIFAVGWTLMGGMRTVIWTDVMQFFLFVGAGLFSLFWMLSTIDGGWSGMVEIANQADKFTLFNLTTDPAVGFTLWVAILAVPFQNLSAFGVDQLNAQRMFCCKNSRDATKAMIEGFDLAEAMRGCDDLLNDHGGHAMAAGVSVKPGRLDAFRERINEIASKIITPDMFQPPLKLDAETDLSEMTLVRVEEMGQLEPLGQGNPEIQLLIPDLNLSSPVYRMGKDRQHAKFWVTDERGSCEVIAWNLKPEDEPKDQFDLAVAPQVNDFNGHRSVQLKLIDWRPAQG